MSQKYKLQPNGHPLVGVERINDKGQTVANDWRPVKDHEVQLLDTLKKAYGVSYLTNTNEAIILIPEVCARYFPSARRYGVARSGGKALCQYEAMSNYLKQCMGISLDYNDRRWYESQDRVLAQGTPMEHALDLAHGVLKPYGLRISRVVAMPGIVPDGPLALWMQVLGVNPSGAMDFGTSNAKFSEETGMPLVKVNDLFRFEFDERILKPGVFCGVDMDGKNKGRPYGHASFVAPRDNKAGGQAPLQFQMDFEHKVKYYIDPPEPLPEQKVAVEQGGQELSLYQSLVEPNGKTFSDVFYGQNPDAKPKNDGWDQALDEAANPSKWPGRPYPGEANQCPQCSGVWTRYNASKQSYGCAAGHEWRVENNLNARIKAQGHLSKGEQRRKAREEWQNKPHDSRGNLTLRPADRNHECRCCSASKTTHSSPHRYICDDCWTAALRDLMPCPNKQCPAPGAGMRFTGQVKRPGDRSKVQVRCAGCSEFFLPPDPVNRLLLTAINGTALSAEELATLLSVHRRNVH